MAQPRFYSFLHRQIPVLILLSVFPGLGYIFLGWLHQVHRPALVWYAMILAMSAWGYALYRSFDLQQMSERRLDRWYRRLLLFYYLFFTLWLGIFLVYVSQDAYKLHYIAIFTQIGASTVVAALLYPERRLYRSLLPVMILPLMAYFALLHQWYGYVLSLFAGTLGWVLYYAASGSNNLLLQTHYQATHDLLTGIYNRHHFIEQLQQTMNSLRESGRYSYLLLIDLDHFKTVNDSLGHDVGDGLLQEIARRLRAVVADDHRLARLGGDEFIVIGSELGDEHGCRTQAQTLAAVLQAKLKEAYVVSGHHIYISASVGIRLIAPGDTNANSLIREADIAMYEVKASGRDGVFLFNDAIAQRAAEHLEIERLLHFALEKNEIAVHFQPQVDATRRVIGAEALVRWNNPRLGSVSPAKFIPIAEQTGLIIELGQHILETAFAALRDWDRRGIELQQLSVNISVRQFVHYGFVDMVREMLGRYLDVRLCNKLIFEITETVVAEDINGVINTMQQLSELGIRFSMDDFGTGYSSLNYLKRLPIEEVKIDRTFVRDIVSDDDDQAMVITMLSITRFFGLTVVAEGVETEQQFDFLVDYRCHVFQGFLFAPALPAAEFERYYNDSRGG